MKPVRQVVCAKQFGETTRRVIVQYMHVVPRRSCGRLRQRHCRRLAKNWHNFDRMVSEWQNGKKRKINSQLEHAEILNRMAVTDRMRIA